MKSITTTEQFNEIISGDLRRSSNSRPDGARTAREWICSLIQSLKNMIHTHGMTSTVMCYLKSRKSMT